MKRDYIQYTVSIRIWPLQVGVPELVVFLNKVDLLGEGDAELQELVEMEVCTFFRYRS